MNVNVFSQQLCYIYSLEKHVLLGGGACYYDHILSQRLVFTMTAQRLFEITFQLFVDGYFPKQSMSPVIPIPLTAFTEWAGFADSYAFDTEHHTELKGIQLFALKTISWSSIIPKSKTKRKGGKKSYLVNYVYKNNNTILKFLVSFIWYLLMK